jgi:hypothetical protein
VDNQNEEVKLAAAPEQDQLQWHAPQLQCFDAKDAEFGGHGNLDYSGFQS